jgi:transposase InsO family protein
MPLESTTAPEASLQDRAVLTWTRRRQLPRRAAKAFLAATEGLTLASVGALNRLRERGHAGRLLADNGRLRLETAELRSRNTILTSRIASIPPRERRHYSPEVRFQILEHMKRFLLSVEDTAHRFQITPQTLYNWQKELDRNPAATTVGTLLRPTPPVTRYANVVRRLARQMREAGFRGCGEIAATLARFGWTPSRRSVSRFCAEKNRRPDPSPVETPELNTAHGRYPNHLWLADVTRIPLLFPFLHVHLTVVFDTFSRLPLQAALSYCEPPATAMLALVRKATDLHGAPRHFVSDRGSQFTAGLFKTELATLGVKQRFGALYRHGSIALIERFFRTLKLDLDLRSRRPWSASELEQRLVPALVRYSYCRPHSALGGRTPAEVYLGIQDQRPFTNLAPRGQPLDPDVDCPFDIVFLDPEARSLPVLLPKAA